MIAVGLKAIGDEPKAGEVQVDLITCSGVMDLICFSVAADVRKIKPVKEFAKKDGPQLGRSIR